MIILYIKSYLCHIACNRFYYHFEIGFRLSITRNCSFFALYLAEVSVSIKKYSRDMVSLWKKCGSKRQQYGRASGASAAHDARGDMRGEGWGEGACTIPRRLPAV